MTAARTAARLLIVNGRAWLNLTPDDIDRGASAVERDPQYRAEIGRSAVRHAHEVGDPALLADVRAAIELLGAAP